MMVKDKSDENGKTTLASQIKNLFKEQLSDFSMLSVGT